MAFTSPVFLGIFLPLLFAVYFLANERARTYVLLLFSICFYACGHVAEDLVKMLNEGGRSKLAVNPFRDVVSSNGIWSVDDDISNLLNTWRNWHRATNVHYFPVFEKQGVVMNPGSAIVMGDCYRGQLAQIFAEAGLFEKKKIVQSRRQGQKAADFKHVIGDLKLVELTHQSFNTGRLDERLEEIDSIYQAMREARASYDAAHRTAPHAL